MDCAHLGCLKPRVTSHGITMVTHGYCHEHRCCAVCGRWHAECRCVEGMTERREYQPVGYYKLIRNDADALQPLPSFIAEMDLFCRDRKIKMVSNLISCVNLITPPKAEMIPVKLDI